MTGFEVPFMAMVGILSAAAGVGGSFAVTKYKTGSLQKQVDGLELHLDDHGKADARMFNEILRSLGRIEGTLEQMKRGDR